MRKIISLLLICLSVFSTAVLTGCTADDLTSSAVKTADDYIIEDEVAIEEGYACWIVTMSDIPDDKFDEIAVSTVNEFLTYLKEEVTVEGTNYRITAQNKDESVLFVYDSGVSENYISIYNENSEEERQLEYTFEAVEHYKADTSNLESEEEEEEGVENVTTVTFENTSEGQLTYSGETLNLETGESTNVDVIAKLDDAGVENSWWIIGNEDDIVFDNVNGGALISIQFGESVINVEVTGDEATFTVNLKSLGVSQLGNDRGTIEVSYSESSEE